MTGTAFDSIPASCWWAIVTVLTVGYGDMSPTTVQGKLVASLLMIIALVVIALPVSIIGTNFTLEWEKSKNEQKAILRASKLPSKLKDIYPQLETWMEEVAKHCYDLRKETRELKVVSKDIKTVQPQDQLEVMEKLVKSANTLTGLASDEVEEAVNACAAIAKRLESIHQKLVELNEDAKEQLQDSLQVAQETFSNGRFPIRPVRQIHIGLGFAICLSFCFSTTGGLIYSPPLSPPQPCSEWLHRRSGRSLRLMKEQESSL